MPPPPEWQPPADEADLLAAACAQLGIEPGYWDLAGGWRPAPPEALAALVEAQGWQIGSSAALAASLRRAAEEHWRRPLDPVTVLTQNGEPAAIEVRLPAVFFPGGTVALALYLEDGSGVLREHPLAGCAFARGQSFGGASYVALEVPLPDDLPPGYHDLELCATAAGGATLRAAQRLIVTPETAFLPPSLETGRTAGIGVHLAALRSERNWGAGDFGDLRRLVEWAATELGAGFVALNPLHAIHNRQPFNTSPYLPASSIGRNYLYLEIEAIAEFPGSRAQQVVASPLVQQRLRQLREAPLVDYERTAALKRIALRLLFREFARGAADTPRRRAFARWRAEAGSALEEFATWAALDAACRRGNAAAWDWTHWPAQLQRPESAAVREFARRQRREIDFQLYLQWQIDEQLGGVQRRARELGMPVGLLHDLPLAVDAAGADTWARRELFATGCRVGAPPDDFTPEGQDWGFPPARPRAQRLEAYGFFIECIRSAARHGGALRIDHVMRLYRLFWIAPGMPAARGTWVREPLDELLGILTLESRRNQVALVGEDLGNVPPELREALAARGIHGFRVLLFENGADFPAGCVATPSTHDLPTLAGFWEGRDIETRRAAGLLGTEAAERLAAQRAGDRARLLELLARAELAAHGTPEFSGALHHAFTGLLALSPARFLQLSLDDLFKETAQQNLPGTTGVHPNWRRKLRFSLEEFSTHPEARGCARMYRDWIEASGRANAAPGPRS